VHAGVLDVLGDGVVNDLAVARDRVDVDLLRVLDELGDDDRVVGRDEARLVEEDLEVLRTQRERERASRWVSG
jgi:hypothetical protein